MSPNSMLAASALASILACPLAAQEAPQRARLFDLRAVLGADAPDPAFVDLRLPVTASDIDRVYPNEDPLFAGERPFHLKLEDGLALVRSALAADASAAADRVDAVPGRILVVGNEAAHAAADRALRAFQSAAAPRVAVEAVRVPKGALADASSSVLDAGRAATLFAEHADAPRVTGSATFGRSEFFGQSSWIAHVHDFDVEVAQGAIASDPTITRLPIGRTLGVCVDPAASGGLLVRAWGRDSALNGPVRTVQVPGLGRNTIDLPRVDTSIFTASAKVPDGGALCIDAGDGDVLVIRTRDTAAGTDDSALRLGVLAGSAFVVPPQRLSTIEPSRGLDPARDELPRDKNLFGSGLLGVDVMDRLFDRADLAREAVFLGTQVLGIWDAGTRASLQASASDLEASVTSTSFTFAFGSVPDAEVGGLTADPERLTAFVQAANGRMSGAALDGDTLQLLAGTERAYLQDYDTQIAAGSVIADPIVKAVFDGTRVWCMPLGREGDALRVLLDVQAQESRFIGEPRVVFGYAPRVHDGDEGRALATGSFSAELPIELGATRAQGTRTLATLVPGEWQVVTAQAIEGSGQTFVVAARCTIVGR